MLKSTGYRRARLFTVDLTNEEQIKTSSQKVKEQIGDVSMIVNFLIVTGMPRDHLSIKLFPPDLVRGTGCKSIVKKVPLKDRSITN